MIYSMLENRIICSSELDENLDEDGNILWDLIYSDAWRDVGSFFKDVETFDEYFNDIVDDLIHRMDEVSNQYEMTLHYRFRG